MWILITQREDKDLKAVIFYVCIFMSLEYMCVCMHVFMCM